MTASQTGPQLTQVHGMRRSIAQWQAMSPSAVCDGSEAQVRFCIEDARHDILALALEYKLLMAELVAAIEARPALATA